jgi:cell division protein FtsB
MKLLKIKLTSILICFVLSCDNSSNETATIVELNNSKKALISKIDSLGVLLKTVEQNISKLDTNKRLLMVTALKAKK